METLLNKIVLVVGGTGGIGAETCKLLHQSGAKVFVAGRNAEGLNTICSSIGIPVKNRFVIDLKNTESIHLMVEEIQSMTGAPIDILINAAGIGIIKSFESKNERTKERTYHKYPRCSG